MSRAPKYTRAVPKYGTRPATARTGPDPDCCNLNLACCPPGRSGAAGPSRTGRPGIATTGGAAGPVPGTSRLGAQPAYDPRRVGVQRLPPPQAPPGGLKRPPMFLKKTATRLRETPSVAADVEASTSSLKRTARSLKRPAMLMKRPAPRKKSGAVVTVEETGATTPRGTPIIQTTLRIKGSEIMQTTNVTSRISVKSKESEQTGQYPAIAAPQRKPVSPRTLAQAASTPTGKTTRFASTKAPKKPPPLSRAKLQKKKKETLIEKFDRSVDEELDRRRDPNNVLIAATTSNENILVAVDHLVRAEAADTFAGALQAAEQAAADAPPEQAEQAAVEGARNFQTKIVDVIREEIPGVKPIQVIGYVGITRPKKPIPVR